MEWIIVALLFAILLQLIHQSDASRRREEKRIAEREADRRRQIEAERKRAYLLTPEGQEEADRFALYDRWAGVTARNEDRSTS